MDRRRRSKATASRKIRYAVVGLGHIAQAAVLPAFKHASRNSELTALISGERKKLEQLGRRYRISNLCSYGDADDLFRSGAIDAVYIALPNDQHKEWAVRAARAGLHVLCEKPMAVRPAECEAMIRAARHAKVKLMIAYRLHFERANLEVAQISQSGKLGELRFFSSDFAMQVSDANIRLRPVKQGGGPLFDIGVYCINAARYCFHEEPTQVWAAAANSTDRRFRNIHDTVTAVMRFSRERLATFTCSFGAADRAVYTVTGTKGSVTLDPAYEYAQGLAYHMKAAAGKRTKRFAKSDQFAPELLYFSDCILKNREPEPAGPEGLADVRIIAAMHRSIASGRWVSLKMARRSRHPTLKQEIRRPAVRREPKLVEAAPASQ